MLLVLCLVVTVKPRILVLRNDDGVDLEKRGWFEDHGIFKRRDYQKPVVYKRGFWDGVQTVFGGFKPDENFYKYMDAPRYSRY